MSLFKKKCINIPHIVVLHCINVHFQCQATLIEGKILQEYVTLSLNKCFSKCVLTCFSSSLDK